MSEKITELVKEAIECVEESTTLPLNTDTLTKLYLHHKLVILYGIASKIPEHLRQTLYVYTLPNIQPVLPFTALSTECIVKLKTLATLALSIATRTEHPRAKIALARIGSIISRSIVKNGIYMSKDSLIGILHELEVNLETAILQTATEIP